MSLLPLKSSLLFLGLLGTAAWLSAEEIGSIVRWGLLAYAGAVIISALLPPYRAHPVPLTPTADGFVLLTGCTQGLGLDMARLFAARGWNLLLVARNEGRLEELRAELQAAQPASRFETLVQDLCAPDATERVLEQLRHKGFDLADGTASETDAPQADKFVDILIHNAGFGHTELFVSSPLSTLQSMLHLHCLTIVGLSHALLPGMLLRRRGRLVIVGSLIGHLPSPRAAVYGATKAFLASLACSLEYEVGLVVDSMARGSSSGGAGRPRGAIIPNLGVVLLTPGPTRTNFASSAGAAQSLVFRLPLLTQSSADVSKEAVEGIIQGRSVIQTGFLTRLTYFLLPKFPTRMAQFVCFLLWGQGSLTAEWTPAQTTPTSGGAKKKQ